MAMGSGIFSGPYVLKRNLQGMCRKTVPAVETGIDQPNDTPLAIFETDDLARTNETLVNVAPFPETGLDRRHGLRRQSLHPEAPITGEILLRHIVVEQLNAIHSIGLGHSRSSLWFCCLHSALLPGLSTRRKAQPADLVGTRIKGRVKGRITMEAGNLQTQFRYKWCYSGVRYGSLRYNEQESFRPEEEIFFFNRFRRRGGVELECAGIEQRVNDLFQCRIDGI